MRQPAPQRGHRGVRITPPDRTPMTPDTPLTTVLIVNHQAGALLARSVTSALSSTTPVEVVVVDNASRDDSVRLLREAVGSDPRVTVIENRENVGFARACNQGLSRARGNDVLFLNPDAVLPPHAITVLRSALEATPDAGMAGPLLVSPNGNEQSACRRDLPSVRNTFARAFGVPQQLRDRLGGDFVHAGEPLPDRPVRVEAISGACMLITRAALEAVGPLDEGYFLHCEDLDWCARFREAGLAVIFVPELTVVHDLGVSCRQKPFFVLWHKHRGMLRYYRRFLQPSHPAPVTALVTAAVGLRFVGLTVGTLGAHARSYVVNRARPVYTALGAGLKALSSRPREHAGEKRLAEQRVKSERTLHVRGGGSPAVPPPRA